MSESPRFEISLGAVSRHFARAARHYDAAAVLAREVGRRMEARLDYVKRAPGCILDLGCGTGGDAALLRRRYPEACYLGLDACLPMLLADPARPSGWRRWVSSLPLRGCAEAAQVPVRSAAVGMVWSNFLLHHVDDPLPVFREVHRVLELDGLFMFACLGPDTLKELRALDPARVHRFIDMHDLGDMLVSAGFAEPVMDMETIRLTYSDFDQLVRDLRHNGATSAWASRSRGLMGKGQAAALREGYERFREAGRLPASFEVIYGHAWKPQPKVTAEGHTIVRFAPRAGGAAA